MRRRYAGPGRGNLEEMGLEVPGWDTIKRDAQALWSRLTGWGKTLSETREDVLAMQNALARYPQDLAQRRAAIQELAARQGELDRRYAWARSEIKKIMDYLGFTYGLDDLGIAPLLLAGAAAAIAAAIVLGGEIIRHFTRVAEEKALIAKLSPEAAEEILKKRGAETGFFGEAKNLIVLGIVAAVILPLLTRGGSK